MWRMVADGVGEDLADPAQHSDSAEPLYVLLSIALAASS